MTITMTITITTLTVTVTSKSTENPDLQATSCRKERICDGTGLEAEACTEFKQKLAIPHWLHLLSLVSPVESLIATRTTRPAATNSQKGTKQSGDLQCRPITGPAVGRRQGATDLTGKHRNSTIAATNNNKL